MIRLGADVVNNWSKQAYKAARNTGYNGSLIISDGFLPSADFIGSFPQADYAGSVHPSPCLNSIDDLD
jgi:hypothetical protein